MSLCLLTVFEACVRASPRVTQTLVPLSIHPSQYYHTHSLSLTDAFSSSSATISSSSVTLSQTIFSFFSYVRANLFIFLPFPFLSSPWPSSLPRGHAGDTCAHPTSSLPRAGVDVGRSRVWSVYVCLLTLSTTFKSCWHPPSPRYTRSDGRCMCLVTHLARYAVTHTQTLSLPFCARTRTRVCVDPHLFTHTLPPCPPRHWWPCATMLLMWVRGGACRQRDTHSKINKSWFFVLLFFCCFLIQFDDTGHTTRGKLAQYVRKPFR